MKYLNINVYPNNKKQGEDDADFYGVYKDRTTGNKTTVLWLRKATGQYGDYYKASISKERFNEALEQDS